MHKTYVYTQDMQDDEHIDQEQLRAVLDLRDGRSEVTLKALTNDFPTVHTFLHTCVQCSWFRSNNYRCFRCSPDVFRIILVYRQSNPPDLVSFTLSEEHRVYRR